MSQQVFRDSKVLPYALALAGMVVGHVLTRHSHTNTTPLAKKKTTHPHVHVLLVNMQFSSPEQLRVWCGEFRALAEKVYANEPHCLSYEICYDVEDHTKLIIYERYATRQHLDGPHQATLRAHKAAFKNTVEPVTVSLTHYTESNIGHMDR